MQEAINDLTLSGLQALLSDGPAIIYTCDPWGDYPTTFISDNVREEMGYEPSDFLNDPEFWSSHIHPDDVRRVLKRQTSLFETGRQVQKYRFMFKGGRFRWMRDEQKLIRDAKGNPSRILGNWVDITEQKKIEEELGWRDQQSNAVPVKVPAAISFIDRDQRFRFVGQGYELLGLIPNKVIGKTLKEVLGEKAYKVAGKYAERVLAGESVSFQNTVTLKDGRSVTFSIEYSPVFDSQQMVQGFFALVVDQAEKNQFEEALSTSEGRLAAVIDNVPAEIFLKDRNGRYLLVNREFENRHLVSPKDALGKTAYDIPTVHQEYADRSTAQDQEVIRTGRIVSEEQKYLYSGTDVRVELITKFPIVDTLGNVTGVGAISTDITERKHIEEARRKSEKNYRALFESAASGIGRTRLEDGKVLLANQKLAEIFGYETPEEFMADFIFSEHYPDENGRAEILAKYDQYPRKVHEITFIKKDGALIYTEAEVRVDKEKRHIDFVVIDVTERHRAEEALRESERNYRTLFENATVGIGRNRLKDGKVLLANQKLAEMFGYENAEKFVSDFDFSSSYLDPDQRARLISSFEENPIQIYEQSFAIRDSSVMPALVYDKLDSAAGWIDYIVIDITDLKKTEKAQRESEALIKTIIDNSPTEIFLKDSDGRYILVNQRFAENIGLAAEEITGRTDLDLYPEDVARLCMAQEREVIETGKPIVKEDRLRLPDGFHDFITVKFPIPGPEDALATIGGIATDITERKQAEEALRESERNYRTLFENATVGIGRNQMEDGKFLLANQKLAEMFGYDSPGEFISEFDIRSSYVIPKHRAEFLSEFKESDFCISEQAFRKRDGSIFNVLIYDKLNRETGCFDFVAIDTTNLKKVEKKQRKYEALIHALIEHSPVALSIKDLDGKYTFVSPACTKYLNVSADDAVGRMTSDLLPPEAFALLSAADQTVLRTGAPLGMDTAFPVEFGPFTLLVTKFPIKDHKGEVTSIGTVSIDITEQIRLEGQLHETQKMEAMGRVALGVAHEFNALFQATTANLELAERELAHRGAPTKRLKLVLDHIYRGGELTDRLLSYVGKQILSPEVIDMSEIISDTVELARPMLGKTVKMETVIADDLWPVTIDPGQLENALLSLIVNARDAMPEGGMATIEAANIHLDEDFAVEDPIDVVPGDYVMVAISDTGVGMTEEVAKHATDPFFTTRKVSQGTAGLGMGLSMVYGFVKQSEGHVKIDSEIGKGTKVALYFPRCEDSGEIE